MENDSALVLPWLAAGLALISAIGKRWWIVGLVVVISTRFACMTNSETMRLREAAATKDQSLQQNFDELKAKLGDTAAIQQVLQIANAAVAKLSATDSKKIVDEQAASLEQDRAARQAVRDASAKLAAPTLLLWEPVQTLVVSTLDDQADAWNAKGQNIKRDELPPLRPVMGVEERPNAYTAWLASLPEPRMQLDIHPGAIESGQVTAPWRAHLYIYPPGQSTVAWMDIVVEATGESSVQPRGDSPVVFEGWTGKAENPALDDGFRTAVIRGVAAGLRYAILKAPPPQPADPNVPAK